MIKVLHASLEFKKGVGGIKAVLMGLLPTMQRQNDLNVSVVTPFYDVYNDFYEPIDIAPVAMVLHIYKGQQFQSRIYRATTEISNGVPLYHYMIKPVEGSPVAWLFNIGTEKDMYQSFPYSEANNRIEYFISALASMLRTPNVNIPDFDIFHGHAWHAGFAGVIAKEFENISNYQSLIQSSVKQLRKMPYVVSTVHMLTGAENGQYTAVESVSAFLKSIGLPADFSRKFPEYREHIRDDHFKRAVLALLYADTVTMVSQGLVTEVLTGKGAGLDDVFLSLSSQQRLFGITNGIRVSDWDATSATNLQEYAFNSELTDISADKQRIKNRLVEQYTNLNPNKMWFVFVGRFAPEKGVDMFPAALTAIKAVGGNFIIMGSHVVMEKKDGITVNKYQNDIDILRADSDVVVIDNPSEQKQVGKLFRGAADTMLVLSHNEACGLIAMEGFACGAFAIGPRIQGIPDSIRPFADGSTDGTGFLYSNDPETRVENLHAVIQNAAEYWQVKRNDNSLNILLARIMRTAKQFDWGDHPVHAYNMVYKNVLQRQLLTFDKIRREDTLALLTQFANFTVPVTAPIPVGRIFQLGFNKCGSQTIHNFFWMNKVRCLHYGNKSGSIASRIKINSDNGVPLIGAEYDEFSGFFDMEDPYANPPIYIALTMFKQLDAQNPGGRFILNTRTKENWINSRCAHVDQTNGKRYVEVLSENCNITVDEMKIRWSLEWDLHHTAVLEYFKDRPGDLLVYNIETDRPEKISKFFKDWYILDPKLFGHLNKTPEQAKVKLELVV